MKKLKLNINRLGVENNSFKIPLGSMWSNESLTQEATGSFLSDEIDEAINDTDDREKIRFTPSSGVTTLTFGLYSSGSTEQTYDFFGYSDDDLRFRRNRFIKSFLSLNFYDSPNPTNQRLLFRQNIFNQLGVDQRDVNNNLLSVSAMPISYRASNPKVVDGNSTGFFIYWFKNSSVYNFPLEVYMYPSYNNALDGISTPLVSVDGSIPVNQYSSKNYIKYTLISIGGSQAYQIDMTDREINKVGDEINIKLYKPTIV